jgi:hypothetical protein
MQLGMNAAAPARSRPQHSHHCKTRLQGAYSPECSSGTARTYRYDDPFQIDAFIPFFTQLGGGRRPLLPLSSLEQQAQAGGPAPGP